MKELKFTQTENELGEPCLGLPNGVCLLAAFGNECKVISCFFGYIVIIETEGETMVMSFDKSGYFLDSWLPEG